MSLTDLAVYQSLQAERQRMSSDFYIGVNDVTFWYYKNTINSPSLYFPRVTKTQEKQSLPYESWNPEILTNEVAAPLAGNSSFSHWV